MYQSNLFWLYLAIATLAPTLVACNSNIKVDVNQSQPEGTVLSPNGVQNNQKPETIASNSPSPDPTSNIEIEQKIVSVTSIDFKTTPGAVLNTGDTVSIIIKFSAPVTVTGTPVLKLNTTPAKNAVYVGGSGTDTLEFVYTVESGVATTALDYDGVDTLISSSSMFSAGVGATIVLKLPPVGAQSLTGKQTVAVSGVPAPINAVFPGVDFATLVGSTSSHFILVVQTSPIPETIVATANQKYRIYISATENGFNFATPVAETALGKNQIGIKVPRTMNPVWINVRAVSSADQIYTSQRKFKFEAKSGSDYRIDGLTRWVGEGRSNAVSTTTTAVSLDRWKNLLIGDSNGIISVFCRENANAPYCLNRSLQTTHTIAGYDGNGDSPSGVDAFWSPMGQINEIQSDSIGNLFISDTTYYRIRVICYAVNSGGFCQGKAAANQYVLTGTGVSADGADNISFASATIGRAAGLVLSGHNLIISDTTFYRLRLLCVDATGICSGKIAGNTYQMVGTGISGDGPDGPAATTAIGVPTGPVFDSFGNVFFSDNAYSRIRSYCFNNTGGFCLGKTVGSVYRFAGDGTNTDGGNAQPFTVAIGKPSPIQIDSQNNLVVGDTQFGRVRLFCQSVGATGLCAGRTAGNAYHLAGIGSTANGVDDSGPLAAGIGAPNRIAFDENNTLFMNDSTNVVIRTLCISTGRPECSGKTLGNVYHLYSSPSSNSDPVAASRTVAATTGLNFDQYNNLFYLPWQQGRIRVICVDSSSGGVCNQKPIGFSYTVAGSGVTGPSVDNTPAASSAIEHSRGIAIDKANNIYVAEYQAHRLFVVCVNTAVTSGPCLGKTAGNLYHVMGTGSSGDGGFNVAPEGVAIAWPQTVLLDSLDNVYVSNYQVYTRVRAICYKTVGAGFCNGKTTGNTYNFLGNAGATCAYGADGTDSATAATCKNYGMRFDRHENLYLASYHNQGRIDVVCSRSNPGNAVCNGKTAGAFYRIAGSGGNADGATGPALTTTINRARGVATDYYGNVFLEDYNSAVARIICYDTTSPGYCLGKTIGTMYRWYGSTGVSGGVMASGEVPSSTHPVSIGGTGAMTFDNTGLLIKIRGGLTTYFQ